MSRRKFYPPSDSNIGFLALTDHQAWYLFKLLLSVAESKEKIVCGEPVELLHPPMLRQLSDCIYQAQFDNMEPTARLVVDEYLRQRVTMYSKVARKTGVNAFRVASILNHILFRLIQQEQEVREGLYDDLPEEEENEQAK